MQFMLQETSEYMKDIVTCNYRKRNDIYINLVHYRGMFWEKMQFLHRRPFCDGATTIIVVSKRKIKKIQKDPEKCPRPRTFLQARTRNF